MEDANEVRNTVDEFLQYLRVRKCSPLTVDGYRRDLHQFIMFLKPSPPSLSSITPDLVQQWLNTMSDYQSASIGRKIAALKSFFNFCVEREYLHSSPVRSIKTPKRGLRIPNYLSTSDFNSLLTTPFRPYQSKRNLKLEVRDEMILTLLMYTGLRRQEVISLDIEDVRLKEGTLLVRQGKEDKDRIVPLNKDLKSRLQTYLSWLQSHYPKSTSLFPSYSGSRLDYNALHSILKRHLHTCRISKPYTLHSLRHTFATMLLSNGTNLMTIKDLLGHSSIASTQIYLHTDMNQRREAVEQIGIG